MKRSWQRRVRDAGYSTRYAVVFVLVRQRSYGHLRARPPRLSDQHGMRLSSFRAGSRHTSRLGSPSMGTMFLPEQRPGPLPHEAQDYLAALPHPRVHYRTVACVGLHCIRYR